MELVLLGTAIVAGVMSVFSPCVLPLLPGVMAYSTEKSKITPLAIVFGLAASYTAVGVATAMVSTLVFDYMDYIKLISGIMIIIMGLYLVFEAVETLFLKVWQRLPLSSVQLPKADDGGLIGGALLGASLGILWIPCVGPFLGSVIFASLQETTMWGAILLLAYSLGLGVPMLVVAYSSNVITGAIRSVSKHTIIIRRISGAILVLVGLYYLAPVFGINLGF